MRFVLCLALGIFLWAGTISIKYPQPSSTVTASANKDCSGKSDGEHLLTYLKMGTITSIQDNGHMLTIGLSPQWSTLSSGMKQQTYTAVTCYAKSQHRPFKFFVAQHT